MSVETKWLDDLDLRAFEAGQLLERFIKTVAKLRHPEDGCPWDLAQDNESLRRFMLEEAYEASEAMLSNDSENLLEELGDVLLQVVLNSQISSEIEKGDIRDVLIGINSKMIRRHPHVFSPGKGDSSSVNHIKANWESIKASEKTTKEINEQASIFDSCRRIFPALTQAYKIGKKSALINFDWSNALDVLVHLKSEVRELEEEMLQGDLVAIRQELSDVFFTLAQLCRHFNLEPETVAHEGNIKFMRRFRSVENLAKSRALDVKELSQDDLEKLWKEVKQKE